MSTFSGKMVEIPEISIDRFTGDNLHSKAFFLSHCHSDHMAGLDDFEFHKVLVENNRFLYVSHISAEILKKEYPSIANNLMELDQYSSTTIVLGEKYITVTPIPAGHCPGSIMFLFECEKTVLYTGDYRINTNDIRKIKAFYTSMNIKKNIDVVYLDTTFFLREYAKFPSRVESLQEICNIIKKWIKKSDKHMIALNTCAKYGYEYLFLEIFKELKMPIHVNGEIYRFYSRVPELDQAVTRNINETRIHCACGSTYLDICRNSIAYKVKTIKISAFRWKSDKLTNGISDDNFNIHYVCYSTHASYEEGVALLKFLKPKKVEPNVLHNDLTKNEEIYKNITQNLDNEPVPKQKKVKLFHIEGNSEETVITSKENSILDSPPRLIS